MQNKKKYRRCCRSHNFLLRTRTAAADFYLLHARIAFSQRGRERERTPSSSPSSLPPLLPILLLTAGNNNNKKEFPACDSAKYFEIFFAVYSSGVCVNLSLVGRAQSAGARWPGRKEDAGIVSNVSRRFLAESSFSTFLLEGRIVWVAGHRFWCALLCLKWHRKSMRADHHVSPTMLHY